MGWFYGFKRHLIVNEKGDLLGFQVSPGNTDDRHPLWELSSDAVFGNLYSALIDVPHSITDRYAVLLQ